MILIEATELDAAYREVIRLMLERGDRQASRLGPTLDLGPTALTLAPGPLQFLTNSGRAINPALAIIEACWILSGGRSVEPLAAIAPRFRAFSDDGATLAGAYGERLRHRFGFDQITSIVSHLRADPNSRRAFMLVAEPEDSRADSLDVPCNVSLMFRIVKDALAMTVVNRSNDVIFGLPYDIFSLSLLHFAVARALGREMGDHLHIANSMHLYLANADLAERTLTAGPSIAVPSGGEATGFMEMLVDQAEAIARLDMAAIQDGRLRTLLEASLSGNTHRRDLAASPGTDWLSQTARAWASRGRTSVVASISDSAATVP